MLSTRQCKQCQCESSPMIQQMQEHNENVCDSGNKFGNFILMKVRIQPKLCDTETMHITLSSGTTMMSQCTQPGGTHIPYSGIETEIRNVPRWGHQKRKSLHLLQKAPKVKFKFLNMYLLASLKYPATEHSHGLSTAKKLVFRICRSYHCYHKQ